MNKGAILIQDVQGMKSPKGIGGVVKGFVKDLFTAQGGYEKVHVLRGALVFPQELPQSGTGVGGEEGDQEQRPYYVLHEPSITAFCNALEIAPLDQRDYQLLAGVQSQENRHRLFIADGAEPRVADGLEWGSQLKVGDHVNVTMLTPHAHPTHPPLAVAVIRYVGSLPDQLGIHFGVEILEGRYRGKGSTNGYFRDKNYFKCEEDCGLFVGLDRVHQIPRADGQSAKVPGSTHTSQPPDHSLVHVQPPPNVRKGDQVVVHNKTGKPCQGTVEWIGTETGLRKFGYPVVRLAMDKKVSVADFEGSIHGPEHLMSCKRNHALFIPASLVVPAGEESLTTAQIAREQNMSKVELVQQQEMILNKAKLAGLQQAASVDQQHKAVQSCERKKAVQSQQAEDAREFMSQLKSNSSHSSHDTDPLHDPSSRLPSGQREHEYEPIPGMRSGTTRAPVAKPRQHGPSSSRPSSSRPSGDATNHLQAASNAGQAHSDPHSPQCSLEYRSPSAHSNQPPTFPSSTIAGHQDFRHDQHSNYYPNATQSDHTHYHNYPPPTVSHSQGIRSAQPSEGLPGQAEYNHHPLPTVSHVQGIQPPAQQTQPPTHLTVAPPGQAGHPHLERGSVVEVTTMGAPRYGVIRWIGNITKVPYHVAGIELCSMFL
jgi:ubiquitin thioesterase CYLD